MRLGAHVVTAGGIHRASVTTSSPPHAGHVTASALMASHDKQSCARPSGTYTIGSAHAGRVQS
jgi:hypothetical protein